MPCGVSVPARSLNARDPISSTATAWLASELGRYQRSFELQTGSQRFFHQPYAFHDRQSAAPPRLAALEIAHRRLQITANVCPRAGHRCP
jgi:hypothetical protein